jgi:hypothetical protein
MTEQTATKATMKVVIVPVRHEAGTRVTRTAARAFLVPRTRDMERGDEGCAHTHGHKTVEAAITCGKKMWSLLP